MQRNKYISSAIKQFKKLPRTDIPAYMRAYDGDGRDPAKIADVKIDNYAALAFLQAVGTSTQHTLRCLKQLRKDADTYARWLREYQAFTRAWPHVCMNCGGSGLVHDSGDRWTPPSDDACDTCVGNGKCPRCGAIVFGEDDEGDHCPLCGWVQWSYRRQSVASPTLPMDCPVEFYCGCPVEWERP